jgi:hypothetical protein
MKLQHQKLSYWCGPAAVANALACFGEQVEQEDVARNRCIVTKGEGTDENEILRALVSYGCGVSPHRDSRVRHSKTWLQNQLVHFGPAILCVDNYQHWVTALATIGAKSVLLFDPAVDCGLELYSWSELMKRWRLSKRRGGPDFYAIGVFK